MEPLEPDPKRRPRQRLLGCGALTVALLVAGLGVYRWAYAIPYVAPPPRVFPVPNAWDEYVAAARTLQIHPGIMGTVRGNQRSISPYEEIFPPGKRRDWVAANRPALDRIREAFTLECVVPIDYYDHEGPGAQQRRSLVGIQRHFVAEALVHEGEGRWGDASQSCLDAIEFAGDITLDADSWAAIIGQGTAADYVCGRLTKEIDHLSLTQTEAAWQRFTGIERKWGTVSQVIRHDRYSLAKIPRIDRWFAEGQYALGKQSPTVRRRAWRNGAWRMVRPKGLVFRKRWAHYSFVLQEVGKPYPQIVEAEETNHWAAGVLRPPRYYASLWNRHQVVRDQARLRLALRIYWLKSGSYPDDLVELQSAVEDPLPVDPYADQAYGYRRTDDGFELWSVGPDADDDDGQPIAARRWHWPPPDGDIVVAWPLVTE